MSVIEQVAEIRTQRKQAAEVRCDELARADAAGKKVSAVEVIDSLAAAGLDDTWFPTRVHHYKTRAVLIAKAATHADLERRHAECQVTMDHLREETTAFVAAQDAKYLPLAQEHQILGAQIGEAAAARQELRKGCKDPAIVQRLADVSAEWGKSRNRLIELRNKQRPLSENIAEHQSSLAKYQEIRIPGADRQYYAGQITRGGMTHEEAEKTGQALANCQAQFDKNAAEIATLEPLVAALEAERSELETKAEASPL